MFYGGPGSGKTSLVVSSWWDYIAEQPIEGTKGRLLLIGGERNRNLGLPDDMVVRFPIDPDKPMAFMDDLIRWLKRAHLQVNKPDPITHIGFDGFSEMCYVFIWAAKRTMSGGDTWAIWDTWREKFMEIIMLADPIDLNAHILGTARVQEVKKPKQDSKGNDMPSDPDWMDFDYGPAMQGWAKLNLGHYFDFVVFMEQGYSEKVKGGKKTKIPQWDSNWLPGGDFWTKNQLAHKWDKLGLGGVLTNLMWPDLITKLERKED